MDKTNFFSIIIPTYNRPQELTACLQSLTKLDYPHNLFEVEVIVVDDGSEKSLETTVKPFQKLLNLTLISQPNSGPAIARNTGVKYAKGKFVVFTDDDCLVDVHWLTTLAGALKKNSDCLIGGCVKNKLINNPDATASQALSDYLYLTHQDKQEFPPFFTSNNIALSVETFFKTGGFNVNFSLAAGEDREFGARLLSQGYKMIYEPKAIIYHAHNLTFTTFYKQHLNYGKGAYMFDKNYRKFNNNKQTIQPWLFYFKLFVYPLKAQYHQPAFLVFCLFVLSQSATVLGFVWEMLSNNNTKCLK